MNKLLTVIVPYYNAEKYLSDCIESILKISLNFEILLIDDGSTDKSPSIGDFYSRKDSRIKIYHSVNKGVSAARNLGLSKAEGEWIWFVDADDWVTDIAFLFENIHQISDINIDCIMFGYKVFNENDLLDTDVSEDLKSHILLSSVEAMKQMYKPDYYPYQGYVWSKLFRKSVIYNNQLIFDETISFNEDRLFCFNFFDKMSGKCIYFPLAQRYFYRLNNAGAMNNLKVRFNPQFITDLKALEIMKDISKQYLDVQLHRYSRVSIVNNALYFYSLLRKFSVKEAYLYQYVNKLLTDNFLISDYFKDSYKILVKYFEYLILHFPIYLNRKRNMNKS